MFELANTAEIAGGLGLFLFAMATLERSLRHVSTRSIRQFVERHANAPWKSIAVGTGATAIMQSSSLVGLIVLALVGASVLPLRSALGVLFGANLGTTVTGWLVATIGFKLDFSIVAYWLVGAGSMLHVVTRERIRTIGSVVTAIGLLLIGLNLMKAGASGFAQIVNIESLARFELWQFLLFGVVAAAILQSSSATISIVLTGLSTGIVDLPSAAAVAVGADLGTTVTIMLGALFGAPTRKQAAAAHFLFNLTTTVVAFVFLTPLLACVRFIGFSDPLYLLVAFHSLFNLLGIILFLPFLTVLARWLERQFPYRPKQQSRFLGPSVVSVPDVAVLAVEKEVGHLIARVIRQLYVAFGLVSERSLKRLDPEHRSENWGQQLRFVDLYRRNKQLEGEILSYAVEIQQQPLDVNSGQRLTQLLNAGRHAIRAAKAAADIQQDLAALQATPDRIQNDYAEAFREAFEQASAAMLPSVDGTAEMMTTHDFAECYRLVDEIHGALNHKVYTDVRVGALNQDLISTLLNVNRELLEINAGMLRALQDYWLEPSQALTLGESFSSAS